MNVIFTNIILINKTKARAAVFTKWRIQNSVSILYPYCFFTNCNQIFGEELPKLSFLGIKD